MDCGAEIQAIRRRRAQGVPLDRSEIQRRCVELADTDFDDGEVFREFRDVFDAMCAIERTQFRPARDQCRLDPAAQRIDVGGFLVSTTGEKIAELKRSIDLRAGVAKHVSLLVPPTFRGVGLAASIVLRSLGFYERIGVRDVVLTAGLATGRYYWAKLGFEFADDHAALVNWGRRANAALGLGLKPEVFAQMTAFDWAYLEHEGDMPGVSMEQLARALPGEREGIMKRAEMNSIGASDLLPIGKALLLTGPNWDARLRVASPQIGLIETYVEQKAQGLYERLAGAPGKA